MCARCVGSYSWLNMELNTRAVKNIACDTHKNRLSKAVPTSTHKLCFDEKTKTHQLTTKYMYV